jgi:hypothetical protein
MSLMGSRNHQFNTTIRDTHQNLGWKINVVGAGGPDKPSSGGSNEPPSNSSGGLTVLSSLRYCSTIVVIASTIFVVFLM